MLRPVKKDLCMFFVNRITRGLLGVAVAGMFFVGCEKFDGPDPYVCKHLAKNQLVLYKTDGTVVGPAIPIDSLNLLIITDTTAQAVVNMPEYENPLPLASIRKIIFQ
jgi:hypothetical protein